MDSFTWRTVSSPKWKTLAASTASASPSMMPSAKCSSLPTPPLANDGDIDGPGHGARQVAVEAVAAAVAVHGGEQDLPRSAPAASRAHSMASMWVFLRPPAT